MNAHLPVIPGLSTFAVRALTARYDEAASWQRDWPTEFDSGLVANRLDLRADHVDILMVFTSQLDFGDYRHSTLSESPAVFNKFTSSRSSCRRQQRRSYPCRG